MMMSSLVPLDMLIFIFLLVLVTFTMAGWLNEREKTRRLSDATRELERILALSAEALQEQSPEKVQAVNELIGTWDQTYLQDVGAAVPKLDLKAAH